MNEANLKSIDGMIYFFRGQKAMLGSDLAILYEVETSQPNRQERRKFIPISIDFMFEFTKDEHHSLICQNGISKKGSGGRQTNRKKIGLNLKK